MIAKVRRSRIMKVCSIVLSTGVLFVSSAVNTYGGFVKSGLDRSPDIASNSQRQADLATVQKALENKLVAEKLAELGYSPAEVKVRLNRLSDAQLHATAQRIDELQTGGGSGLVIVGVVIAAIVGVMFILEHHYEHLH